MQVFEFHFNPKAKEDIILDSFIYEPENVYEQKLGNLYILGELTNVLPHNYRFLNNLASTIKKSYYQLSAKAWAERSLRNGLKEANNFLENQEKKGDVSWLGNLNLATISLKGYNLNFTKVGNIKILLSRGKKIIDIGRELTVKSLESYPLKIFSNIISGKLMPEDKVIVLTKETFDLFSKENLLPEVLSVFDKNLKVKEIDQELKKFFNKKRNILAEICGIFLLIFLEPLKKETIPKKEPVVLKKKVSVKTPFLSLFSNIKKGKEIVAAKLIYPAKLVIRNSLKFLENKISIFNRIKGILLLPKKKFPRIGKVFNLPRQIGKVLRMDGAFGKVLRIFRRIQALTSLKLPTLKFSNLKRILILSFLLIIILGLGNYIFKTQKQKEVEKIQIILIEIQQKITEAEGAFIYKDEKRANLLYQEAWKKVLPLTETGAPSRKEALRLKESIERELFPLNNLEKVLEPQLVFEFESEEFSAQKIIVSNSNLYFLNSISTKIYKFKIDEGKGEFIQIPDKVKFGLKLGDSILFFSEANRLISLKESTSIKTLEFPYADFSFDGFSNFGSNIYFLDSQKGEIVKFKFEEDKAQLSGEFWLNPETKKPLKAKSMAIDGSIWILNENDTISRYHKGEFQKELILDFFPPPQEISKIFAQSNLPYLYLLTPNQNRVIVLDNTGEVIKQYQSEKFDDLKDFTVSEDDKTIYLLNGLKVYQIKL